MFLGNASLRKKGEKIDYSQEMINELIKCKQDIVYFAENYFYIVTGKKGKSKIELYEWQKKVLKAFVETPDEKRHCIVKIARQSGKTTVSTIFLLWYALFNKDKTIAIVAHKQDAAIDILKRIKTSITMLPLWLQQGLEDDGWNKKSVSFENGSRILASATSAEALTSLTVNLLFLDEFAKVPSHIAEEFITSTYPVISSYVGNKIIMVSTPKGLNHFYEFWAKAIRKEDANNFFPISVGWWEVPGRDEKWKEGQISDIGMIRFSQEFSCKFLGGQSTLIDSDILERISFKDPIATKWNGLLAIYRQPVVGGEYVLGVDTGKGTGRDYSVIQVLWIKNEMELEQVATYRNNLINPHDFAQVCVSVAKFYNNAHMMVENNDIGSSVADVVWHEFEYEDLINADPRGLGVRSTKKTKLKANMLLKEYLEKERLNIYDERTVYELSRFEEIKPNVFAAGRHEHDDCVTSLLWALYFIITEDYDGKNYETKYVEDEYNVQVGKWEEGKEDEEVPVLNTNEEKGDPNWSPSVILEEDYM